VPREHRIYRSRAEYRRRMLLIRGGAGALVALLLVAVGGWILSRPPTPGRITVYDTTTGHRLWSRTVDGGYVVVLAVTPAGALVADADDCIHGGQGEIDLVTPGKTTFVASASACAIYRFRPADGVNAERRAGRLYVIVPSQLGRATALLPCPCPPSSPSANGIGGSPVEFGATARVQLGKFTLGAD
jgi:hypothetical protein